MQCVQNFNKTTLTVTQRELLFLMAVTQRELLFLNLKIFIFWKQLFHFFYPFHRLQFKRLVCYISKLFNISKERHCAILIGDWCF